MARQGGRDRSPDDRQDGELVEWPEGHYSTDLYTDRLIEFIDSGAGDGRPFFAYAAYTSPHWPLQVPDAELDRYRGDYDEGYDALRSRRFAAVRRLGIVPREAKDPTRTPFARAWNELSPEEKRRQARTMELYAAMVENLDHHVGRLVQFLKETRQYENTLILFFSDNGAEGNPIDRLENLGRVSSYAWLGPGWAQAATPFRLWKGFPTEGGVRVPAIVRFGPDGRRGSSNAVTSVKDVAPTLLELAGVSHPAPTHEGRSIAPLEGRSLVRFLRGEAESVHGGDFTMGYELFGRRALRKGDWKIVWLYPPYGPGHFELYDLARDPTESNDLASAHPAKLDELVRAWDDYAAKNGVILPIRDMGYALEPTPP